MKQVLRIILVCFIATGIMFIASCGHYPESVLYLSQDSELPSWILSDPAIRGNDSTDDLEIKFEFYAPDSVLIYVSSESRSLSIQLEGKFSWIDQNIGGENGSNRYFSIVVDDKLVVFRQEIGNAQFLYVVPSDAPPPERKSDP